MNNKEPKKKIETSKIIIFVAFIMVTAVTVDAIFLMHQTGDTSPLSYIIPSAYGVLTAATGFYYWKAKNENKLKLRNQAMLDALKLRQQFTEEEILAAEEEMEEIDEILSDDSDDTGFGAC